MVLRQVQQEFPHHAAVGFRVLSIRLQEIFQAVEIQLHPRTLAGTVQTRFRSPFVVQSGVSRTIAHEEEGGGEGVTEKGEKPPVHGFEGCVLVRQRALSVFHQRVESIGRGFRGWEEFSPHAKRNLQQQQTWDLAWKPLLS